jgi:hypothetical protein
VQRKDITSLILVGLAGCAECDVAPITPIEGEGEGDVGEGEGEGEGEGDVGDGEGEGEPHTTCVFPPSEVFPFTCEGDEDWCDDVGRPDAWPDADIVATWGRIEGNKVILEVRMAKLPFRVERSGLGLSLIDGFGFDVGTAAIGDATPYVGSFDFHNGGIGIGSTLPFTYPLASGQPYDPFVFHNFGTTPLDHPYRGCAISISPNKPYVKYEFDFTEGEKKYIFYAARGLAGTNQNEFSIDDYDFYFLTPLGGKPDEDIAYESICTMTCEGAGGALQ